MTAFRVLAVAYALVSLLLAPAWLSADEVPTAPSTPTATVDPATQPAAPADDAPVATAQAPEEPVAESKPAATTAKKDDKAAKDEPVAHVAADGSVTISDFKFTPGTITVNVGDTITWTNNGPTVHSAKANDGTFNTGLLDKGQSGSHTFTSAGTISYICEPHPFMKGTVVVQAASSGSGGSSSGGTTGGGETNSSATAPADDSGLPNTGGDTLLIALLGFLTLAAGMWLRRGPRTTSRT